MGERELLRGLPRIFHLYKRATDYKSSTSSRRGSSSNKGGKEKRISHASRNSWVMKRSLNDWNPWGGKEAKGICASSCAHLEIFRCVSMLRRRIFYCDWFGVICFSIHGKWKWWKSKGYAKKVIRMKEISKKFLFNFQYSRIRTWFYALFFKDQFWVHIKTVTN